jgi:hydrogenase nickel incorporation protein HypB
VCTTCGCSTGDLRIEGDDNHSSAGDTSPGGLTRLRPFNALHAASIGYHFKKRRGEAQDAKPSPVKDSGERDLHFGLGVAHAHAPGLSQGRMVQIEQDILSKNNQYAAENRRQLAAQRILALNLLSSPGSGKTTLLTETIIALRDRLRIAVIEGDQQTTNDADRIRATGAAAIQINTGKGCHLDASMIRAALARLAPPEHSVVMIENVGNLVCPAGFDLGEAHKVVVLSVTEGEDKPLKYPDMFRAASLMLMNKVDLLPYLRFDVDQCMANARRVNPKIQVLQISAISGQGMADWLAWIEAAFNATVHTDASVITDGRGIDSEHIAAQANS